MDRYEGAVQDETRTALEARLSEFQAEHEQYRKLYLEALERSHSQV